MFWRGVTKALYGFIRPGQRHDQSAYARARGHVTHVLILDGTMSSLTPGCESNAGTTYRLLSEIAGPNLSIYYEAGVQWQDWRATPDVMMGRGINRQIRRAYGYLSSRYKPGDKIFLFGYSRGAYAVRSLAGLIDAVGLLISDHATERNISMAYRHYQCNPGSPVVTEFASRFCHQDVPIEVVGVWDTVKALGMRLPILWRWAEAAHSFHSHRLGPSIRHGFHALALHETRAVYEPVLWESSADVPGKIEQVWFRGSHGDIGGQLNGHAPARALANIPLVWMLENAQTHGLPLPDGWQARYPCDAGAPSVGTWRGWGKIFLLRKSRTVGQDPSERVHESVVQESDVQVATEPAL